MVPYQLLDEITSTGPGPTVDLLDGFSQHALQVISSGTGGDGSSVELQGSLDGNDWYQLGSDSNIINLQTGTAVTYVTGLTRYVRANATQVPAGYTVSAYGLSGHATD
jgi:hypothetical protein